MKSRVLVLLKRTSYRVLVEQGQDAKVKDLIAKDDPAVRRMRRSHEDHTATSREVFAVLEELGATYQAIEGPRTPVQIQGAFDLVITVGGDGTLLAASHQVGPNIPVLGVNSAPDHSVGFFCAAVKGGVRAPVLASLEGRLKKVNLARMLVEQNGVVLHRRVLNDALFCHSSPAITSRYILEVSRNGGRRETEEQRSSGLWIGPAAGSTAAQRSAGGRILPLTSRTIQFVVREPYTPVGVPLKLPSGLIEEAGDITIHNKMRDSKIFVDGHHIVFDTTIGDVLTMRGSGEPLTVLGLARNGKSQDD